MVVYDSDSEATNDYRYTVEYTEERFVPRSILLAKLDLTWWPKTIIPDLDQDNTAYTVGLEFPEIPKVVELTTGVLELGNGLY